MVRVLSGSEQVFKLVDRMVNVSTPGWEIELRRPDALAKTRL